MSISVKICGLTRPRDIEAAICFGADYLGFIIEAESPRKLSVSKAQHLISPIKDITPCVGVTVNPSKQLVAAIGQIPGVKFVQLHGRKITPDFIQWIRSETSLGVIRSLAIRNAADLQQISNYIELADRILLDAPPPKGSTQQGGHGLRFDWKQINWRKVQNFNTQIPIGLAGGLNPKNIAKAHAITGLNFFDVSSGVETKPCVKDPSAIAEFIKIARKAES